MDDGDLSPPDDQIITCHQPSVLKLASHTIKVALKPNAPSSINYDPETVEGVNVDTDGKFSIEWTESNGSSVVSGYQWCEEVNGTWEDESSCPEEKGNTLTGSLPRSTSTMANGKYRYKVRAYVNVDDYYEYSGWVDSEILEVKHYPGQISNWILPNGSSLPGVSFELRWDSVADPDPSAPVSHYELQWSNDGSNYWDISLEEDSSGIDPSRVTYTTIDLGELVEPDDVVETSNILVPITLGDITFFVPATSSEEPEYSDLYTFRVRACNESGCGDWSTIKQLTTPEPPEPEFSADLPEEIFTLDQTITWDDVGASSYRLKRMVLGGEEEGCIVEEDGNCWLTVVPQATSVFQYFTGGSQPGTYQYKLEACNDFNQCSSVSSSWIEVHNLANTGELPAVSTEAPTAPGTLPYSADVNVTGNAVINIPLQTAPGVNGLQPNLSLRYTSARFQKRMNEALPEDILGYGWRLGGLSSIRRCVVNRPDGASVLLSNLDSLCLDGEPLTLLSGSYWEEGALYRTLRDSSRLIELHKNEDGKVWFEVNHPNGSVYEYGATVDSRLRGEESTHFAWSLNKVTDAFGNTMDYKYHRDLFEGINYPLEITYGNQGDAKIEFQYGTRTDAPPVPLQEIQQEQLVLLHHIRVYLDENLQREYKLISEEEPADADQDHYRRLKQVQLCAYDESGNNRQCLNPLEFGWEYTDPAIPDDFETGIETVTNGYGAQTKFTLERISDNPGEEDVGRFNEGVTLFGEVGTIPGVSATQSDNGDYRTVVTKVHRSNGYSGDWHVTEYAYQGVGLTSDLNWGFLGYSAQRIYDEEADIVTYRQFRQDFPYFGKVARQVQYHGSYQFGELLTQQRFSYDLLALSTGYGTTYIPYVSQSLNAILEGGQILGYTLNDNTLQLETDDNYGDLHSGSVNIKRAVESVQIDDTQSVWGVAKPVTEYGNVERSVERTTLLDNRTDGSWLIGFISAQEQRHFRGEVTGAPDQESSVIATPYGDTNRVYTVTQYPEDTEYQVVSTYEYDAYGNVVDESVVGQVDGAINGVTTQTRGTSVIGALTDRRYPSTLRNTLGHEVYAEYDSRFGSVTHITDSNEQSTEIEFDPFGREVKATNSDGVAFTSQYNFCHGICPTVGGIEASYWVQTSSAITPTTEYYYDQLGRLVQKDIQTFSGNSNVSRLEYRFDTQGRLEFETAPFFAAHTVVSDSDKPKTSYDYDQRNRIEYIDKAGGGSVEIDYSVEDTGSSKFVKVSVTESVVANSGTSIQVKDQYYDLLGDLVRTIDDATGEAVVTDYTYDGGGFAETVKVTGNGRDFESNFIVDHAGFRTSLTDPNVGTVTSSYNAFGELERQIDNKNQSISYLYDELGRLLEREDEDGVAQWKYDAANAIGNLENRSYSENGSEVFFEKYSYDSDSKLASVETQLLVNGTSASYQHSYGYDSYGRIHRVTYPNGTEAYYHYNDRGYMESLSNDAAGVNSLQTFDSINAWGQIEQETYGNGVVTNRTYNPNTGRLETINTGSGLLQNNEYHWRSNGTLESRLTYSAGNVLRQQEDFSYDGLNRLRDASIVVGGDRVLSTQYDKLGNILSKTSSVDLDTQVTGYQYGEFGNAGPNAVSGVSINNVAHNLYYDENGAIERYDAATGDDKWISWNARQLPTEIVLGTSQSDSTPTARDRFKYGPDGQRYYRESSWMEDGQLKTEKAYIIGDFEVIWPEHDPSIWRVQKTTLSGSVQHLAITDPASISTSTAEYQYLHRDHLGSIEKITDSSGVEILGMAFNPDGSRRTEDWSADLDIQQVLETLVTVQHITSKRGYTGHEHLDRTGLIHMNGRIYDPTLGRFLSPDPIVQQPTYSQSWNRYSYVFNSPLSFTDPSGYEAEGGGDDGPKDDGEVIVWGTPLEPTTTYLPGIDDGVLDPVSSPPGVSGGGSSSSDSSGEGEEEEQDGDQCDSSNICRTVTGETYNDGEVVVVGEKDANSAQMKFESLFGLSKQEFISLSNAERIRHLRQEISMLETKTKVREWKIKAEQARFRRYHGTLEVSVEGVSNLDPELAQMTPLYQEILKAVPIRGSTARLDGFINIVLYPAVEKFESSGRD
ncbi:RHS repeat-associated core domain-containing protein [Microbulbifer sp. ZKSA004]|uniref:RHS repeat-associated core domain-containing protein n=1 Tax=Microbulbifer sp. ZKSA004 TaxID=3243389 RepID=UPI004039A1A7